MPLKHTRKEQTHMSENKLLTIYGARLSKNGNYINLILVEGEAPNKRFYTACVKIDNTAKTHGFVDDVQAHIAVPLLHDQRSNDEDLF